MKSISSAGLAAVAVVAIAGMSGCGSSSPALVDNDPTRIICRDEPDTGSRLPKRTCKEAREWEAIAQENQEARRNMRRPPTSISTGDLD